MNLRSPISSVIPSGHGHVLAVLARTDRPLTGRDIAALLDGALSQKQTNNVLRALVRSGVVLREVHPPAHLYVLNREHVAAEGIVHLATLRNRLIERIREHIAAWRIPPEAAWLFGSLARGEGDEGSDVDLVIFRPAAEADPTGDTQDPWDSQLASLSEQILAWSGNDCRIVEFSIEEYDELVSAGERLPQDIARDGLRLYGRDVPRLTRERIK